jgi:hypothetical protein
MKPYEPKKQGQNKSEKGGGGGGEGDKKSNKKGEKTIKHQIKRAKRDGKNLTKGQ